MSGQETAREAIAPKVRRALQLLLAQRGMMPGAKLWELKKVAGADLPAVLEAVKSYAELLGLELKALGEGEEARYFLVFKEEPPAGVSLGMRIDDIAMLAACLAYLHAKAGTASRSELEELLKEKFPLWRIRMVLARFVRLGYLEESEGSFRPGWRARIEVDLNLLSQLVAALRTKTG
jgi:hypothetical protein